MPRGEKPNPSGPFISINTWAFALHSPHSANISSQPNGKPLLNAQYRADCSSQLIACVFQAGVRNGAVKQLRASPRERSSPRGAAQAGARRQQQCRRRHARLLPGARPHLSAASLPGSPSNCADCQAGQALAVFRVFIPISFHSLDLPRHRVPDPGDVRVLGKALQAPGFEPPGPKWSGGTPHPLA